MRLTVFSDYALRMLMYGAGCERRFTIEEVATAYGVSRAHMMKVANLLTRAGFLKAVRGRSGGLVLGKPAAEIGLREVIEAAEPDFRLVECFGSGNQCVITGCCKLQGVLADARHAFTATLARYTLADLALPSSDVRRLTSPAEGVGSLTKPPGGVHA